MLGRARTQHHYIKIGSAIGGTLLSCGLNLIVIHGTSMTTQPANDSAPDDIAQRGQLTALARGLRDLHKHLIQVETQYFGTVGSPLELLQLVTNHPHFAWLQKLSALMAQMDERIDDEEPLAPGEASTFRRAFESLIGPSEQGDLEFRAKYNALLHDAPEIVMAHGAVRKLLGAIQTPPGV
jgi:hypothetical protein